MKAPEGKIGISKAGRKQEIREGPAPGATAKQRGSSLIEVLVALLVLTIVSVAVLQGITLELKLYNLASRRSGLVLKLWNQVQEWRAASPAGEPFFPSPGPLPLYRFHLRAKGTGQLDWEVLRAGK